MVDEEKKAEEDKLSLKKTSLNKEHLSREKVNQNQKEDKVKQKKTQNRQIMWAVILMIAMIVIILLVPYVWKNYVNKFVYINLDFQKTKLGEITFYSTRVPITDSDGNILSSYSMNFRNDPRKLGKAVEVDVDKPTFQKDKMVFISLDPEMDDCEYSAVALIGLSGFLRDFGGLKVKSAATEGVYALENNLPYITCRYDKENTVIEVKSGEETSIKKTGENCYELTFNNCEINEASEKFMLVILEEYMSYFVRA